MSSGPWGGPPDKPDNKPQRPQEPENDNPAGGNPWANRRGGDVPDLEHLFRQGRRHMKNAMPGGDFKGGKLFGIAALVLLVWWGLSGFYRVGEDERGIVLRFGAFNREAMPGLRYHLPYIFEEAYVVKVTRTNRVTIGNPGGERNANSPDGLFLTSDQNIIDIGMVVQWKLKTDGARDFLFSIRSPDGTLKVAAMSALREVIGQTPLQEALTQGRGKIQEQVKVSLQQMMDLYKSGIEITEIQLQQAAPPSHSKPDLDVRAAYDDVQTANSNREQTINEAQAYANQILPEAEGQASRIEQEAIAYKAQVVARAKGEVARYQAVLSAYQAAPNVTGQRLWQETLESVLSSGRLVLLGGGRDGAGGVSYLPLDRILPAAPAPAGATAPATPAAAIANPTGDAK